MPITDELLAEITAALGAALPPTLSSASAVSDIFEAYILTLVIRAAQAESATVSYLDVNGAAAQSFIFRTSPGYIWSASQAYTYALLQFPGKEPLEAHVGVRVAGKSGVLHEFDVCVIRQSEADTARQNQVHPRSSKVVIGVECKFYTTSLTLGLARAFIGLGSDVSTKNVMFVTNAESESVQRLLTARGEQWANRAVPASLVDVERLKNEFQSAFKYFKAA
jgi:hypothetical protein